jgi:hypothetical protein
MEKTTIEIINELENSLEKEAELISEAINDVMTIAHMNDDETAMELIKRQFVVINRQDIK